MKKIFSVFMVVLLAGCATPKAAWVPAEKNFRPESQNYSVELPDGWMRSNNSPDYLTITKEGTLLQFVMIEKVKIEGGLKHTKKKLSGSMLPHELSEIFIDNVKSNPAVSQFELLENSPAEISGIQGFRFVYSFRNKDGLAVKSTYCGAVSKDSVFTVRYSAPVRYYYDRDFKTFESVLRSFRIN